MTRTELPVHEIFPDDPLATGAQGALPLDGWRRIPARWGHATPEGDGFHVAQGLARQFGDNGVRVAEQQDQHPDPGEFSGIDTDHGDGVGHLQKSLNYLFGHGLGNVEH